PAPPSAEPVAAPPSAASATAAASVPPLPADSATTTSSALPAAPAIAAPSLAAEPLPKGTRVLQIGDSFAAALGGELSKLLKEAGLRSTLEYKTASYIPN